MPFWKKKGDHKHFTSSISSSVPVTTRHELPATNAVATRPKPDNPFLRRGDELFNQGSYPDAVFMYNEAIRQDEHNPVIHLQLALARSMCSPPQLDAALRDVNSAIQIEPSNGNAWKLKGNLHMRMNENSAAEDAFLQATSLLQGYEKLQAQQSLADVRTRMAFPPPAPPTNVNTLPAAQPNSRAPAPNELPTRNSVILPSGSTGSQSHPSSNLQPLSPVPPIIQSSPAPQPQPQSQSSPAQTLPTHTIPAVQSLPTPQPSPVQAPPSQPAPPVVVQPSPTPQPPITQSLPVRSASTSQSLPVSQPSTNPAVQRSPSLLSPPISPLSTAAGTVSPSASPIAPPAARPITPNMYVQGEVLAQQFDIPTEAPPSYSAPQVPLSGLATGTANASQISNFRTVIATKRQGSLYLKPLTMEGQIDTIQLFFDGKTYLQSVILDLPPRQTGPFSWDKYYVSQITHPGTTLIDYDCETAASYEGYHLGTTSVLGYAEEYREHQVAVYPQLQLTFEASTIPPAMTIDAIVQRIQLLQANPTLEDNITLDRILGLAPALNPTTRTAVEDICMSFNRAQFDAPTRFIDFLTTPSFSVHLFGTTGIGLTNFLFHILLGAEMAIRMLKLGTAQRYPNVMKASTSALVVLARLWMENVTIRRTIGTKYVLVANMHTFHSEGLLKFAEAINWPYMEEARLHIPGLYAKLIANPASVPDYVKDWLFGLVLPGKFFRQRILSCLVLACPSTKHLNFAPYYGSGLIVGNKSYWPKRTVLGRVLGGLKNPKLTCGWVGPVPAPIGCQTKWVLIYARHVNFVTPVVDDLTKTNLELLGFDESDADRDPTGTSQSITDINRWKPPAGPPPRTRSGGGSNTTTTTGTTATTSQVRLQAIRLNEVVAPESTAQQHRATLEFACHGQTRTFTLYSNPVFVHVPKCVGDAHPIHERLVQKLFRDGLVLAKDLKAATTVMPPADVLTVIDATEPGEEQMARAWCAEVGRHAVVRKGGIGCFTCAVNLATKRTGLGFNVLIWCN